MTFTTCTFKIVPPPPKFFFFGGGLTHPLKSTLSTCGIWGQPDRIIPFRQPEIAFIFFQIEKYVETKMRRASKDLITFF